MGKTLLIFLLSISMWLIYVSGGCTSGFLRSVNNLQDFGIVLDVCFGQLNSTGAYSSFMYVCNGNSLYYYNWLQDSTCSGSPYMQFNFSAYGLTHYVCGNCTEYMKMRTYQYDTSDCTGSYNYTELAVTTDACFNGSNEDGAVIYGKLSCSNSDAFMYVYATGDCSGPVINITYFGNVCEDGGIKNTVEYCGVVTTTTTTASPTAVTVSPTGAPFTTMSPTTVSVAPTMSPTAVSAAPTATPSTKSPTEMPVYTASPTATPSTMSPTEMPVYTASPTATPSTMSPTEMPVYTATYKGDGYISTFSGLIVVLLVVFAVGWQN